MGLGFRALGPWGLGALGPWGLGALGPWGLGALGPLGPDGLVWGSGSRDQPELLTVLGIRHPGFCCRTHAIEVVHSRCHCCSPCLLVAQSMMVEGSRVCEHVR